MLMMLIVCLETDDAHVRSGVHSKPVAADLAAKADHARLHTHPGLFITSTIVAILGLVQIQCAALLVQVARLQRLV
jgi:D-serine deaminase-like pyridoxal phosphate-dependent protein